MITSVIGKTFLEEYNRRNKAKLSPQQFFNEIFHPLFYDHEKYMQWIQNSPFVQGVRKDKPFSTQERAEKIQTLATKISTLPPDASFAIGFPASEEKNGKIEFQTTSGQVSNVPIKFNSEGIYLSWIGAGLSIGLAGGNSILFNNPVILLDLFQGWQLYRNFLNQYEQLKGNQIETWNGQWISYRYSDDYNEKNPATGMVKFLETDKSGVMSFRTQSWTELLFGICTKFKKLRTIVGYVFSFGQTNTTIGFITFSLPAIEMPLAYYYELFGENEFLQDKKKIQSLYGTAYGFARACEKGSIGAPALEPKDLKQYMNQGAKNSNLPDYLKIKEEQFVSFNVYQTWLLAMLGSKNYWQKASAIAIALVDFELEEVPDKKISTKVTNLIESLLNATSIRNFITICTEILRANNKMAVATNTAVEILHQLSNENFIYFLTLIKFRYSAIKVESIKKEKKK